MHKKQCHRIVVLLPLFGFEAELTSVRIHLMFITLLKTKAVALSFLII